MGDPSTKSCEPDTTAVRFAQKGRAIRARGLRLQKSVLWCC